MSLYVRHLVVQDHPVRISVARDNEGYVAVVVIYAAGSGTSVVHETRVTGGTADRVDRAAENEVRRWLGPGSAQVRRTAD